jgi:hypothetical protein
MKSIVAYAVAGTALLFSSVAVAQPVIAPDIAADHRLRDGTTYYAELERCSGIQMAYAVSRTGTDAQAAALISRQYDHSAFNRVVADRKLNANDVNVLESVAALLAPISAKARNDWMPILAANGGEAAFNAESGVCIQALHASDFEM